jgi:hypothetical protein
MTTKASEAQAASDARLAALLAKCGAVWDPAEDQGHIRVVRARDDYFARDDAARAHVDDAELIDFGGDIFDPDPDDDPEPVDLSLVEALRVIRYWAAGQDDPALVAALRVIRSKLTSDAVACYEDDGGDGVAEYDEDDGPTLDFTPGEPRATLIERSYDKIVWSGPSSPDSTPRTTTACGRRHKQRSAVGYHGTPSTPR